MTELVDRIVDSLRAHHDLLADIVANLTDEQLEGPSGASEWRLCDVFSHLGSGAEITLPRVVAAVDGVEPGAGDNQAIWDRWNALSPRAQAEGFVEHDEVLVSTLEALSPEQRSSVLVDMGFLPAPVPLAVAAGMRLNEVGAHAWDITVGLDPEAGMDADAAAILLELYTGPLGFMLGFATKPDQLAEPASVAFPADTTLVVTDAVTIVAGAQNPTATFVGPAEAAVRLLMGRLGEQYTSEDVDVTGSTTLADLRRVFPGY